MNPRLCLGLLLACADTASAGPMIHKGDREISISGSPDFLGPTCDTLNVSGGYGWFARDAVLVRGTFLYSTIEDIAPGENDYRMREVDVGVEYHLDTGSRLVPYLGGELGWRRSKWASDVNSGFVVGPRAGLKFFIADNAAFDFALSYKVSDGNVFISDYDEQDYYSSLSFGIRVLF
jgi:hypothetical protein